MQASRNIITLFASPLVALVCASPAQAAPAAPHPPIPIPFTLKKPGCVTLVIEDTQGKRVRNLISEMPFPPGANTAYWDGLDDRGRDPDAASHGVYDIPGKLVTAGTYRVRGLVRPPITVRYEMTPYNPGRPPWDAADRSSGWLANHTPPQAALFVPEKDAKLGPVGDTPGGQVLIGSYVTEGGSGLAWLDLQGRKRYGQFWIGGVWTGAPFLAYDAGPHPVPGVYAYTGSAWENELRLHALVTQANKVASPRDTRFGTGDDRAILAPTWKFPGTGGAWNSTAPLAALTGLAVWNGLEVVSLPKINQLLFVDAAGRRALGTVAMPDPRGLAFDSQGRLLVLSGQTLQRYVLPPLLNAGLLDTQSTRVASHVLPGAETLVAGGLQDPQGITLDSEGDIYISDAGTSHQVKVFSPNGKPLHVIGHPGAPGQGSYDPMHMNNPAGLTVDSRDRLWVTENNYQPKRVSVWDTQTGKLVNAFYGPYKYGGGGVLDPHDKTLFNIDGMTLKLDWKTGTARPIDVYYRTGVAAVPTVSDDVDSAPMTPIYAHGHQYLTNCYTANATNGVGFATLWQMGADGVAKAVAACGEANEWGLLKTAPFRSLWPTGTDLTAGNWWSGENAARDAVLFVWNDRNGDGKVQPNEVVMRRADTGSVTVAPDLSFVVERVDPHRTPDDVSPDSQTWRYAPIGWTASGAPRYSLDRGKLLSTGAQPPASTGMGQALLGTDGWLVLTTAPKPFPADSVGGSRNGIPTWQYPSLWPGLHPSHNAPMPDRPGELIGTTRLLGGLVTPRGSDAGPLWAINGNKGNVYLFTQDGLFVATLFQDSRLKGWDAPRAVRGMSVNGLSLQEESFYPTITQTVGDGRIYLQGNGCLLDVAGLEGIRRLPSARLTITLTQLAAAQTYFVQQEAERQQVQATKQGTLIVALPPTTPTVDGKLDEWPKSAFVPLDNHSRAALAASRDRLYAAFQTGDGGLLNNSPQALQNLFKTGGALDIQLDAVPGGERLLVTQTKGKTVAVLYRPRVPGTTTEPVKFVSNMGALKTTVMDRVDDVSGQVMLAGRDGNFELSVPLSLLSLSPQAGQTIRGDVGLLRGNGFQTLQRVYWHNKATGLVSDLASEAELTPSLWGTWEFRGQSW